MAHSKSHEWELEREGVAVGGRDVFKCERCGSEANSLWIAKHLDDACSGVNGRFRITMDLALLFCALDEAQALIQDRILPLTKSTGIATADPELPHALELALAAIRGHLRTFHLQWVARANEASK